MPKEAFKTDDEKIVVGWSKTNSFVEIGVSIGEEFIILSGEGKDKRASVEDDLWYTFDDPKEFKRFLKALERAGKQAFGKK